MPKAVISVSCNTDLANFIMKEAQHEGLTVSSYVIKHLKLPSKFQTAKEPNDDFELRDIKP